MKNGVCIVCGKKFVIIRSVITEEYYYSANYCTIECREKYKKTIAIKAIEDDNSMNKLIVKAIGINFKGSFFCFTGFRSEQLEVEIQKLGGYVTTSVSYKTNYVVAKDINSSSTKTMKAREYGIPVIGRQDLERSIIDPKTNFNSNAAREQKFMDEYYDKKKESLKKPEKPQPKKEEKSYDPPKRKFSLEDD